MASTKKEKDTLKKILTEPLIFILKVAAVIAMMIVAAIIFKRMLPASFVDKLFKEDKAKENAEKLNNAGEKIKFVRTRLRGINDEIKDFLKDNKKYN
jgi:hypothetical protein